MFYLVLSNNGPLQNPNRDQSAVKMDVVDANPHLEEWIAPGQLPAKKLRPYPTEKSGENPFTDFAKKYYFDNKDIAIALAQEEAKKHPGKEYFIAQTTMQVRSPVQEAEVLPLISNG